MADSKVSDLPAVTAADTDDLLYLVEDGQSRKWTLAQALTFIAANLTADDLAMLDPTAQFGSPQTIGAALRELADAIAAIGPSVVESVNGFTGIVVLNADQIEMPDPGAQFGSPQSIGAALRELEQALIWDAHAFYPGVPTASAKVLRVPVARPVTFPANFAGSYFKASANATASTVFDVQKNGSSIGTVTIGAGGTTATFATSGGAVQSLAAGDLFAIIAPNTPDATLADPGFVFAGTR